MGSDSLDKYNEEQKGLSVRQKVTLILCLAISSFLLYALYMFYLNLPDQKTAENHQNDDEEQDEDYWMDEEDIEDDWDYWVLQDCCKL